MPSILLPVQIKGFGRAIALKFAQHHWSIIINGKNRQTCTLEEEIKILEQMLSVFLLMYATNNKLWKLLKIFKQVETH